LFANVRSIVEAVSAAVKALTCVRCSAAYKIVYLSMCGDATIQSTVVVSISRKTAEGAQCVEALANRDPRQYRETDDTRDALGLAMLLDSYAGRAGDDDWRRYLDTLGVG
jgi:hypothetical protein